MATNNIVLNTIAASHADLTISGGTISLTGMSAPIRFSDILLPESGLQLNLVEQVQSATVSWTLSNSTTYEFTIYQNIGGIPQLYDFVYTSQNSATNAQIGNAIATVINKLTNFNLSATYTSGTSLTITALSPIPPVLASIPGEGAVYAPTFTLVGVQNITITANMAGVSIASNTTATPSVITTGSAHGLVTGSVITIASADETKLVSGTYRVTYLSTTTYSLANLTTNAPLAGTSTTTATVTLVAQNPRGQGTDLITNGITTALSTNGYTLLSLLYRSEVTYETGGMYRAQLNRLNYWISANLVASPYTATTNYSTLASAITDTLHDYVIGGTTAEPALSAVIA